MPKKSPPKDVGNSGKMYLQSAIDSISLHLVHSPGPVQTQGINAMQRLAGILVLCIFSSVCAFLAARALPMPGPSNVQPAGGGLVVLGQRDVVVDKADRSTAVECVFQLQNPTSRPIHINEVYCGCTCMASRLEMTDVLPGATVALNITVRTFDAFRAGYKETIRVATNAGDLHLSISGKLPLPDHVVYRPAALYLDPLPGARSVNRSVLFRVPKQCCKSFTVRDVQWVGTPGIELHLAEQTSTELYREFELKITVSADETASASGVLTLDSGCGLLEVRVHPASRVQP